MYDSIIETAAQQRIRDRVTDAEQECRARGLRGRRRTSRQDVAARLRKYGDRLDG